MQSYLIKYFFSNETIQVLFWTLIHSLWQGIMLAIFAAIILMCTKKTGTQLRCKLLSRTLALFIILSLCTFFYELSVATNNDSSMYKLNMANLTNTFLIVGSQLSFTERLISFFQPYENFIVLAWIIVIAFKCFGFLTGLRNIYILKHRKVFDAGEYWNDRLNLLIQNTGIKKPVILLKSFIAEIPMVVGYFKPIILFPAAALTSLAPEEVEAILLHELAHIRRKDYLVNFLQRITEIIFFFNPAVLWISSLIKEERENCCDDIAVQQTKNKKQFIHALVSFQEYNMSSKYAPSFSGRKNFLLNRVKRIITNNNKTLNNMEKIFLISGIVITGFIATAFSQHNQLSFTHAVRIPIAEKIPIIQNKKDSVPLIANNNETKNTISTFLDGKLYKIVEVNEKLTELYVDNQRIPDDKISNYSSVINKLQEKLKADKQAQKEEMKTQKEALEAQVKAMKENQVALNDDMTQQAEDLSIQAQQLQNEIMESKMANDSGKMKIKTETLEAQAEYMKQKALAVQDEMKNKSAKMQKEYLKAQENYINQKDIIMKDQQEKIAEVMKEKNVIMKEQVAKQAEMMVEQAKKISEMTKDKNELIKKDMEQQIEQLKEQNEKLELQLKQKTDSIYHTKTNEPQGA